MDLYFGKCYCLTTDYRELGIRLMMQEYWRIMAIGIQQQKEYSYLKKRMANEKLAKQIELFMLGEF
jgi:hypothetical protein